jgi:hypothetical protein
MLLIEVQLLGNVYRITRITGWQFNIVNNVILILNIGIFILSTFLFYRLTKKYLGNNKLRFFSIILWVPYFALFTFIFTSLFPIAHPGEKVGPATGLLVIGTLVTYPFYLTVINLVGTRK